MSINEQKIHWKPLDVLWVFCSMFALIFLGGYLLELIAIKLDKQQISSFVILWLIVYQWLAMLVPLYFFTIKKYGSGWKDFGFRHKIKLKKALKYIGAAYLLYFLFTLILGALIVHFDLQIPGYERQKPHLPLFGDSGLDLFIAFVVIAVFAPVVEEIFFRGFVLQALAKRFGHWPGSILTALLFASFHFEPKSALGLFVISLILNELFLRSRSLWVVIGFHLLNNSVAFLIEYLVMKNIIVL